MGLRTWLGLKKSRSQSELSHPVGDRPSHPVREKSPPKLEAERRPFSALKHTDETVEYFTPTLGFDVGPYLDIEQKQGIHHVGRYQWACLALAERNPKSVLDIACGAGYGSFMLASALPNASVLGIDYDERAIGYAGTNHTAVNLRYAHGSVVTWIANDALIPAVEAIVSFDTIEHLLHREIALMRMADNLADDGWLLLSTPCGHDETRLNPGWEHHKIEYAHADLYGLLSRFFGRVVQPQDDDFPLASFWRERVNATAPRYFNLMNPVVCKNPIRPNPYVQRAWR
jgi:2-polyprenyl-3-methyl-5-hydroxy-6-metoxy-1,4-benzoquinol methylase